MTWNPVTGCTKISPGCDHCYAVPMSARLRRFPEYADATGGKPLEWTGTVKCLWQKLEIPFSVKTPKIIFTCSMADLFHSLVPFEFIKAVFEAMREADWHTFQVLTKRIGRAEYFADKIWRDHFPPNVWIGTSVESPKYLPRLKVLGEIPAVVRFASFEPLLSPLAQLWAYRGILDWAIAGGESGNGARPMEPAWVHLVRDFCIAEEIPFFFKQWSQWVPAVKRYDAGWEEQEAKIRWMYEKYQTPEGSFIARPGSVRPENVYPLSDEELLIKVRGKSDLAYLDGRIWREYPNTPYLNQFKQRV